MAYITNTDSSILPYNDDYLLYDKDREMYVITEKAVRELCGFDLLKEAGTKVEADIIRYEVSQDIMNFISMYSLYTSYRYKVWLLAKDEDLRSSLLRVLADQMRYYKRSGAGLLKDMTGVDISKGKAMDLSSLRGNVLISASVEQLLKQMGMLYTGNMYYSEFEEDWLDDVS